MRNLAEVAERAVHLVDLDQRVTRYLPAIQRLEKRVCFVKET